MDESMKVDFGDFAPGKDHQGNDCMCLYWEHKGIKYGMGYRINVERSPHELSSVRHLTRRAMETTVINVLAREATEEK